MLADLSKGLPQERPSSCADGVRKISDVLYHGANATESVSVEVSGVAVGGSTATIAHAVVVVEDTTGQKVSSQSQPGLVRLIKQAGRWYIAGGLGPGN